jgi:myosin heavy subunit
VAHHPGDTVSCTQAEALVLAAEARTSLRPRRRTELLRQRIHAFEQRAAQTGERLERQKQAVKQAKQRLAEAEQQVQQHQQQVDELEKDYQIRQRKERPTSRLAQARQRLQAVVKRTTSRTSAGMQAQGRLDKTTAQRSQQQAELADLYQRLLRFEQDNATNSEPVEAEFRLDAGFGTYENVALLIEMGYDLYTKPHSHKIVTSLKEQVDDTTVWTRVGANAELVAWPRLHLKHCPYALDVALERFYTGQTLKHSALFHFGSESVTEQLPGWFEQYNGRQTIEAGIKESKQVFYLHYLKVRSEPAIYLQEAFVLFAANFIRWAAHWLEGQAQAVENALNVRKLGVKRQVHVAAHVSAQIIQDSEGKLLKFSEQSAFAGQLLRVASDHPSPHKLQF